MKFKIGIVIPVFNGLDYTKKAIDDLSNYDLTLNSDEFQFEIIIADDASTDGTFEWIKDNHPKIHIVVGNGNLWWSGGVNLGTKFALDNLNCTHILWWNNDVIIEKNYFNNLISIIKSSNENTIIGSKVKDFVNQQLIWSMGGFFNTKTGEKDMYARGQIDHENWQNIIESDWFPGMGTTFHKSVFEKIGYCNEKDFPQYHGDSDFTFRAKLSGFQLFCYPQLIIFNDTRNTSKRHDDSLKRLFQSLKDIKSIYNLPTDLKFYKLYATSKMAYFELFKKYSKYIGGFFKWKLLGLIGKKKTQ